MGTMAGWLVFVGGLCYINKRETAVCNNRIWYFCRSSVCVTAEDTAVFGNGKNGGSTMTLKESWKSFWAYIASGLRSEVVPELQLVAILCFVLVSSAFIFLVYRVVSHRPLYNKSMNISIAVMPFFICTIILCCQSNLVLTLSTIGALAIVRFRTAIKDPVDMAYVLWSIHLGIMAGCQLFMVAVLTSVFVTLALAVWENLRLGNDSYTLVVHCDLDMEDELNAIVSKASRRMRIKSRNYSPVGMDYVFTLSVRDPRQLTRTLTGMEGIHRFSLIEYGSEDMA